MRTIIQAVFALLVTGAVIAASIAACVATDPQRKASADTERVRAGILRDEADVRIGIMQAEAAARIAADNAAKAAEGQAKSVVIIVGGVALSCVLIAASIALCILSGGLSMATVVRANNEANLIKIGVEQLTMLPPPVMITRSGQLVDLRNSDTAMVTMKALEERCKALEAKYANSQPAIAIMPPAKVPNLGTNAAQDKIGLLK